VADQTLDSTTAAPRRVALAWPRTLRRAAGLLARHWLTLLVALLIWFPVADAAATYLIVDAPTQQADAIVVLAGSAAYLERTAQAARLYRAGVAPYVLLTNDGQLSSWVRADGKNPYFFERAFDELRRLGVPRDRIHLLPERVGSTYDEAVRVRQQVCAAHLRSVMVVSSGYHTRRARWTFASILPASVTLVVKAAPFEQAPRPTWWWIRPRGWQMVAGEYVKAIVYWIRYPALRGHGAAQPC
jgi:uncharacterized SAM-binding protein YcdF (DUF218 family)